CAASAVSVSMALVVVGGPKAVFEVVHTLAHGSDSSAHRTGKTLGDDIPIADEISCPIAEHPACNRAADSAQGYRDRGRAAETGSRSGGASAKRPNVRPNARQPQPGELPHCDLVQGFVLHIAVEGVDRDR